jgi:DNA polymerase
MDNSIKSSYDNYMKKEISNYINFLKKQPAGTVYREPISDDATPASKTKQERLNELRNAYITCTSCPLATQGRTNVVFGTGNPNAKLMLIGEGPGRDEDLQALPFVGRAGKLLNKILQAMELSRNDVYISNIVKCRPPKNRAPLPNESQTCKTKILFQEIEIIQPTIICTLGTIATQELLERPIAISKVRGIPQQFATATREVTVIPTFHPAYLLRNPAKKKEAWNDMQQILARLKAH